MLERVNEERKERIQREKMIEKERSKELVSGHKIVFLLFFSLINKFSQNYYITS